MVSIKHMLILVGEVDAESHIRRILSNLFANTFAIDCSSTSKIFGKDVIKF